MHSGWHAVNIDFQSLDLKSDCKRGDFWGLKILNFNLSQHKQFLSTQIILIHRHKIYLYVSIPHPPSETEVHMNLMPTVDVLFI
jgi:hypothetical protein